jgi:hypothetical protein
LFVLAKQQGRHFRAVTKEIEAAGVKPAMEPEKVGRRSNRREGAKLLGNEGKTLTRRPSGWEFGLT